MIHPVRYDDMLKRERQLQIAAQIRRMIVRKEKIFLNLDQLSPFQLVMFYVALCVDQKEARRIDQEEARRIDQEEARRLNNVEEKIQNLNGDYLKLFVSVL
jgi:hypothetical protein